MSALPQAAYTTGQLPNGCFYTLGVLFLGVVLKRALQFWSLQGPPKTSKMMANPLFWDRGHDFGTLGGPGRLGSPNPCNLELARTEGQPPPFCQPSLHQGVCKNGGSCFAVPRGGGEVALISWKLSSGLLNLTWDSSTPASKVRNTRGPVSRK